MDNGIFTPHGKHLIAGEWVASDDTFGSDPASGSGHTFSIASAQHVHDACIAAEDAFWEFAYTTREVRAVLLERIADEIEKRGSEITAIGVAETGLPEARLEGERGRTTGQLRLFAQHIRKVTYLDQRHDAAEPDRVPAPKPDLLMLQRPIGPVAVFGASNFPLAFSTAGGDTAAALAAGCPVVVKGHAAHPGTGEIIAEAIHTALAASGLHQGTFSFLQSNTNETGSALVQHPVIKAVGFTGSLAGGRALYDLCVARPEPIPFYGELGSVNPMFLLSHAVSNRADDIGTKWAGSLAMGAGQFCTNPGVAIVLDEPNTDKFIAATAAAMTATQPQTMLTNGIAQAYAAGCNRIKDVSGVTVHVAPDNAARNASPALYEVTGDVFLITETLTEEVFGPAGIIVRASDSTQMLKIAHALEGQLTCTIHMDNDDRNAAIALMPVLERKAGRILANGFPTGVEVSDAMVHGGPFPASTNFGATSVGTLSIRRFLRPVCYQNLPSELIPVTDLPPV